MSTTTQRPWARLCIFFTFCSIPLLLVSCSTGRVVHEQFRSVNIAYADALNEQMLLNLARLDNGHPAYYLAIGAINNRFTFSSQTVAGTTGQFQDQNTTTHNKPFTSATTGILSALQSVLQHTFGYSVNETATASSNPDFQFIPLNNDAVAKQVLQPISTDVFTALYLQGYPIDQLMRVLIERIETPALSAESGPLVLINSPSKATLNNGSYARFLRVCGMLRELQENGYLELVGKTEEEPVGRVSFGGGGANKGNPSEGESYPTPKDFSDAEANGFTLKSDSTNHWKLFRKHPEPVFALKGDWRQATGTNEGAGALENQAIALLTGLRSPNAPTELEYRNGNDYEAITNLVRLLHNGITIQTTVSSDANNTTHLVLRSFDRAMDAAAAEQKAFATLLKDTHFLATVCYLERRPILRTVWGREKDLQPPLAKLNYSGRHYEVTDSLVTDPLDPLARWNRDVFRLLVALNSQVTVDISKFQRQVIELQQ